MNYETMLFKFKKNFYSQKRNSNKGAALLIAVLFFLIISVTIVVGSSGPVIADRKAAQNLIKSKASYFASEAGVEDVSYRIIKSKDYDSAENLTLDGYTASTAVVDNSDGAKEVTATGNASSLIRKTKTNLIPGTGASFYYGLQVGNGGLVMSNNSRVDGNVFSNGQINGTSDTINGDVISAGPSGLINGINTSGSAYAHSITDSAVGVNAYYQTISGTSIGGTSYPGSQDQSPLPMPISDAKIEEWKAEAAAGGTHTSPCPYIISDNVSLGPKKINCDLYIDGTNVVTLNGNVWVSGNIYFSNNSDIKINPSLGDKTVVMVADKETNRSSSGRIFLSNYSEYFGTGSAKSYILLISQNNSAETGGGNTAINAANHAAGKVLLYAPHGKIELSNDISIKEASAYKIQINNSAIITYETGIANLLFTSGPSGGYSIDSWKETE